MARFDVKMLGDDALAAKLAELQPKVERRVISGALRKAAQNFADGVKPGIPRSLVRKYGTGKHMADSLRVRSLRRKRGRVGWRAFTGTREELGIPDNAKAYYPAVIEYGSKTVAPRAFIRGPFLSRKESLKATVIREIREGIARLP